MDRKVKKSIVLLGNGESLKKVLITNIMGRDLSTLTSRTFLSRTQVYENNMYKFACTPDLDKNCEDIRDVFKIQRPDMSLLVVQDGFNISDVQSQIEKLHKMTGKPEEDFVVVLPLTCKNTNLPFRCCSLEQLIRELQKPAVDEHQLTTTRRSADYWMPTTDQVYTLSTAPEDDSVLVQPTEAEFDEDSYDNYFPTFQETAMKHKKLFLRDSSSQSVCVSSAGQIKSCGSNAPNKKLLDVRSSFIDRTSGPVLNSLLDKLLEKEVFNDSERESADETPNRRDKARFIIDTVRKKGDAASSEMMVFLCELDPYLCKHLGLK